MKGLHHSTWNFHDACGVRKLWGIGTSEGQFYLEYLEEQIYLKIYNKNTQKELSVFPAKKGRKVALCNVTVWLVNIKKKHRFLIRSLRFTRDLHTML